MADYSAADLVVHLVECLVERWVEHSDVQRVVSLEDYLAEHSDLDLEHLSVELLVEHLVNQWAENLEAQTVEYWVEN